MKPVLKSLLAGTAPAFLIAGAWAVDEASQPATQPAAQPTTPPSTNPTSQPETPRTQPATLPHPPMGGRGARG